jgi:hypothetical protein
MPESKVVYFILVITFIFSISGCSKSNNTSKDIRDITSLFKIRVILKEEFGGVWEIKNNLLKGQKGERREDFAFAYNIIPNPKNSEEGRWEATEVRFYWSSLQLVFGYNEEFLILSMGKTITDPPQILQDFVEQHCDCTWDLENQRLNRNRDKQQVMNDVK